MTDLQTQEIINKLNTIGQGAWEATVAQAKVESTIDLIWTACAVLGTYIAIKVLLNPRPKIEGETENALFRRSAVRLSLCGFILLICALTLLAFFMSIENIFTGFFNPNYWAVKHLLHP